MTGAEGSGEMLVMDMLRAAAERAPDRPLVRFLTGRSHTAREVLRSVEALGAGLQQRGVAPGDRIAIMLPNRFEFLQSWLASHAVGAVAVPINTALRGPGLKHVLDSARPRLVLCEPATLPAVCASVDRTLGTKVVLVADEPAPEVDELFADLLASADSLQPAPITVRDPCCVMFTSGTTGPSKGVTWSNRMSRHVAEVVAESMAYSEDDVLYTCLPLFHGNALATTFLPALRTGALTVVGDRFSASGFWKDVVESGATATNILGVMTPILLRQEPSPAEKEHRLRVALVIPAPESYYRQMEERFHVRIIEGYGQVDHGMSLWNSISSPRKGSCGRPTRGFECRVVDEHDREVAEGQAGELVVRWTEPFTSQLGYWGLPEATLAATRNLWFHTGDLMRRDADGWFYFIDRAKDVIRRRGENISSFEVEQACLAHPDVLEVAAYAVPSELSEDEVAVAAVLVDGSELTALDLVRFLEPQLPYFAVPRYVQFVDALPKTQTEKIQKNVLKSSGVTAAMWDREEAGYVVRR